MKTTQHEVRCQDCLCQVDGAAPMCPSGVTQNLAVPALRGKALVRSGGYIHNQKSKLQWRCATSQARSTDTAPDITVALSSEMCPMRLCKTKRAFSLRFFLAAFLTGYGWLSDL